MFKRFSPEEHISSVSQVKNSVQRHIQNTIVEQFPALAEIIDQIIPKKEMTVGRAADNVQLIIVKNEILFYNQRDGPFLPSLRLLHKYPEIMSNCFMQVDRGAVRFILGGANIMCPGGRIPISLPEGSPVAIYVEGKEHAIAVGTLLLSTETIRTVNRGIGVEVAHCLGDGLWQAKRI